MLRRSGVFLTAFVASSLFFYFFGGLYLELLKPAIILESRWLIPRLSSLELKIIDCRSSANGLPIFDLDMKLLYESPKNTGSIGKHVSGNLPAINTVVFPLISFSLILAWPRCNVRQKTRLFLLALPALLVCTLLQTPFLLLEVGSHYTYSLTPIQKIWIGIVNENGFVLLLVALIPHLLFLLKTSGSRQGQV